MKRFTATEKWQKPWFQDLAPYLKCLWLFLCDNCDCAGVWEMNWKAASLFIGKSVSPADLQHFRRRVAMFGAKLVIGGFIEFQYGALSADCKAHNPIFRTLAKHSLSKGYPEAIRSLKEEEEEEDKDQDKDQGGGCKGEGVDVPPAIPPAPTPFEDFWKAYPKRVAKGNAETAWAKHECAKLLPQILTALVAAKGSPAWTKDGGQFIPYPATWLNRKGWEDELFTDPQAAEYLKKYGF